MADVLKYGIGSADDAIIPKRKTASPSLMVIDYGAASQRTLDGTSNPHVALIVRNTYQGLRFLRGFYTIILITYVGQLKFHLGQLKFHFLTLLTF
jgi:hypothetical protein